MSVYGGRYPGYSEEEIESASLKPLIGRIRERQLQLCRKEPAAYESEDVDYITRCNRLIQNTLMIKKKEDDAVAHLDDTMRWRKSFGVKDIKATDFPAEYWEPGFCMFLEDYDGDVAFWGRLKTGIPIQGIQTSVCRICIYYLEKFMKEGRGRITVVGDIQGCGMQNMDWKIANFLIFVAMKYYPGVVKQAIALNLPMALKPILLIVDKLLTIGPKIILVPNDEIYDYIPPDQVPKYFGGDNSIDFTKPPAHAAEMLSWHERMPKDIDEDMIKRFYKTYTPIIAESKRLVESYDLM